MTKLGERIARRIRRLGPISVADYMTLCLSDPDRGYYQTKDPLGTAGDFVTAPEVSQLFGEIIGAWIVDAWKRSGAPDPLILAELGPGRGTLMRDILRVGKQDSAFRKATRLHLVESSPHLTELQAKCLADQNTPIEWHTHIGSLPEGPLFLIANEFFDVLPIRQYVRLQGQWRERMIDIGPDENLVFAAGPVVLPMDLDRAASPEDGTILEVSPARAAIVEEIAARIAEHSGAALIVDYGDVELPASGSLQAVMAHRFADPLAHPGAADLSAHVDFAALRSHAKSAGAVCHGPLSQGGFLTQLGLLDRAAKLATENPTQARKVKQAVERLISDTAMGSLFKVMAIGAPGVAPPPFTHD